MFPGNLRVTEGRLLNDDEKGVLVPEFARKETYDFLSIWLIPQGGQVVDKNLTQEARENKKNLAKAMDFHIQRSI